MTRRVHPHTDRNADLNRSPRSSFPWLTAAPGSHTGAPKPTCYLGAAAEMPEHPRHFREEARSLLGGRRWLRGPFLGGPGRGGGRARGPIGQRAGLQPAEGTASPGRGTALPASGPSPAGNTRAAACRSHLCAARAPGDGDQG